MGRLDEDPRADASPMDLDLMMLVLVGIDPLLCCSRSSSGAVARAAAILR